MSGIKKGKNITVGWEGLLPKALTSIKPEGYSTAEEICEKLNISKSVASSRLKELRENKKIECLQIKNKYGNSIWVYKD